MEFSVVSTQTGPFALPAFHAGLQAQAEELAGKFVGRHREVWLHRR